MCALWKQIISTLWESPKGWKQEMSQIISAMGPDWTNDLSAHANELSANIGKMIGDFLI